MILSAVVATAHAPSVARTHPSAVVTDRLEQEARTPRQLEPGKPIESELVGGDSHTYAINLSAGEFLYVVVEQQSLEIKTTLVGPDAKQILEVDSPDNERAPQSLWYVSEVAGTYQVILKSKVTPPGKYQIRIVEQRVATASDRLRRAGQKELLRGGQLLSEETAESATQAAEKFQSSLDHWRESGDHQGEAEALASIGRYYSAADNREQAMAYYSRALALLGGPEDKRRAAYVLFFMGNENIASAEQKPTGLSYFHQALPLMREVGDRWGEALVLDTLGVTYASQTETKKAFEYLLPLLSLELSLGDRGSAAVTLNYIGGLHSWLGDYQKALDYYTQALPLSRAAGHVEGELFALRNIGNAYFGMGDYERALTYLDQVNQLNQTDPEAHASTLNSIGAVHAKLGDQQKALNFYTQALPIWRQLKLPRAEGSTLTNIGSAYRELGDYQKALDFYNQALPLTRYVGDRRGEAAILINIGRVQISLGDARKGLDSYRQAREIGQAVGDQTVEARAFDGMARSERSLGNLDEARSLSEAALKIVEFLRLKIATRELRVSYQASVQQYYETHIDLLMRLHAVHGKDGYDALALEASERARSRSLLESLNEAGVDIRQGVAPQLLERERSLQQQLHAKAEVHMRLLSGKHTEAQIAASKRETDTLLATYQEVEAQIRIQSPRYAALTQPVSFRLKEIQQMLDPDTVLLEYWLGDERSFLWAVTKSSLTSFALPKRVEIETTARRVYDLLTARNQRLKFETANERVARIARADADFARAAGFLSELLLAPAGLQLKENRLLIVSDGALHYIPFAALPIPSQRHSGDQSTRRSITEPQPLIAAHEIINLPSALSLATLRRELTGRKPAAKTLAVIADPVFDREDERVKTTSRVNKPYVQAVVSRAQNSTRSRQTDLLRSLSDTATGDEPIKIQRLPFTRREANQIAALIAPAERKEALDFAASRATATSGELGHYRYVHFATHGFLNSRHPELSGIVLSLVDQEGVDQDGFLRAYEIFNLKLPAEMVVLSGCRTGLGKEIKGEGLVGLTRGFMYAGAARVVVSLWDVSDEASAELMSQFYREMLRKQRLRPSAALQAAQLRISKVKRWEAPYYWAAFVLHGEPR